MEPTSTISSRCSWAEAAWGEWEAWGAACQEDFFHREEEEAGEARPSSSEWVDICALLLYYLFKKYKQTLKAEG